MCLATLEKNLFISILIENRKVHLTEEYFLALSFLAFQRVQHAQGGHG